MYLNRTQRFLRGSARAALLLSVLYLAYSAREAATVEPLPELPAAALRVDGRPMIGLERRLTDEEVMRRIGRTVVRNPFRPDRTRTVLRYGTLASEEPSVHQQQVAEDRPRSVAVSGVVLRPSGRSMAVIHPDGSNPRLLRVGEEHAGYRLLSVSAELVRVQGPDSVAHLRVGTRN